LYPKEFYYILLYPKHLIYTKQFDMNYLTFLKNICYLLMNSLFYS